MADLPGDITIREYRPGDAEAILACFNRVFAVGNPRFVPRTLERWRWQFERNPAGNRIALALTPAGEVIAQFCALPAKALFQGREVVFHQAVDSMADPRYRRLLFVPDRTDGRARGASLFVRTASLFVETWGTSGADLFGYGFPIPIAWRVGKAHLGYEVIRTQLVLARPVGAPPPGRSPAPPSSAVGVEEVARFDGRADRLWERCAAEFGAAIVRDSAYLGWRYAEHPEARYRCAIAKAAGAEAIRGLAVYRRGEFSDRDQGLLVEWLVPSADLDAGRALVEWALSRSREDGADRLAALIPDSSPWFLAFQREGFLAERTKYVLVGRNYLGREDAFWFRKNWAYTLGDFDLV